MILNDRQTPVVSLELSLVAHTNRQSSLYNQGPFYELEIYILIDVHALVYRMILCIRDLVRLSPGLYPDLTLANRKQQNVPVTTRQRYEYTIDIVVFLCVRNLV